MSPAPTPAGSVAAPSPSVARVDVTGTETCTQLDPGVATMVGSVRQIRGEKLQCRDEMSDPRVSGTTDVFNIDYDQQPDGSAVAWWPSFAYRNGAGSWVALSGRTSVSAAGLHDISGVLQGTGGFVGLEYHQHVVGTTYPWSVTGWIDAAE